MRQKILLALLAKMGYSLSRTVLVKLMFLLRHETSVRNLPAFYDFLPYRFGPFSFVLYREISTLQHTGYLSREEERIGLTEQGKEMAQRTTGDLPKAIIRAVHEIRERHGQKSLRQLITEVYQRYPWFASKAENVPLDTASPLISNRERCLYTIGYEGKSLDAFFDKLLQAGIQQIIDVRANPVSRRYGFSKSRLSEIATRLDVRYHHIRRLGIVREHRIGLSDLASYQRLLDWYKHSVLPERDEELTQAATLAKQAPAALLCVEADFHCCHRSCAAEAIAQHIGCEVRHL